MACETWGGLHAGLITRLKEWARLVRKEKRGQEVSGADTLTSEVVAIWRMRLATGLLHARVNYIEEALDKIGGVPARSQAAARELSRGGVANLLNRVQVLGRLGGGEHLRDD